MENYLSKHNSEVFEQAELSQTNIRFAVLGDSHLSTLGYDSINKVYILDQSGNTYKRILQQVTSSNPRFVIHGGDCVGKTTVGRPPEEKYKAFRNVTKGVLKNKPVFFAIGNWDRPSLFKQYISPRIRGISSIPGTNGKVKLVILDNADGTFHPEDINLLKSLSTKYQYLIDFHQPLRVGKLIKSDGHVISSAQTNLFFKSIPTSVRNQIIAIFNHHLHSFYYQKNNLYSNFSSTSFFVAPCSGKYLCSTPGYLRVTLNRNAANRYIIKFNPAIDFIKIK